jgi:hypothetical protein
VPGSVWRIEERPGVRRPGSDPHPRYRPAVLDLGVHGAHRGREMRKKFGQLPGHAPSVAKLSEGAGTLGLLTALVLVTSHASALRAVVRAAR